MEKVILDIHDISELIGKSPRAIRIAMSRGQEGLTIPPSSKVGGRRFWMRQIVDQWLDEIVARTLEFHENKKLTKTEIFVGFVSEYFNLLRKAHNNKTLHSLKMIICMPDWGNKTNCEV